MLTRLEQAERILDVAKRLRAEHKKYVRMSERARDHVNTSGRGASKAQVNLEYQAHHIVQLEAELHAACVDAGVADLREPEHYAQRTWRLDGWHEYPWQPTKPKALQGAAQ